MPILQASQEVQEDRLIQARENLLFRNVSLWSSDVSRYFFMGWSPASLRWTQGPAVDAVGSATAPLHFVFFNC
jgi:hypothetical protein